MSELSNGIVGVANRPGRLTEQLSARLENAARTVMARMELLDRVHKVSVSKDLQKMIRVSVQLIDVPGSREQHLAMYNAAKNEGIQLSFWESDGAMVSTAIGYPVWERTKLPSQMNRS